MLALERVRKTYRGRETPVLDGVDLHLGSGEVIVLSGPSGSGKTTLLSLLTGHLVADDGIVCVFERNVAKLRRSSLRRMRRELGIVPQKLILLDDRSALENVALALELRAVPRDQVRSRARDALDHFELGHLANTKIARMSLGERQRVAIARAVVTWPALVICDEPTAHLDREAAAKFISLMDTMQKHSSSILCATNDRQVISAAALRGWHHLELRDGHLSYADAYDITARVDEENGLVADSGPIADVVPIPIEQEISDTIPNQVPLALAAGDIR